eukprot:6486899-Amphidinium_carterae.1
MEVHQEDYVLSSTQVDTAKAIKSTLRTLHSMEFATKAFESSQHTYRILNQNSWHIAQSLSSANMTAPKRGRAPAPIRKREKLRTGTRSSRFLRSTELRRVAKHIACGEIWEDEGLQIHRRRRLPSANWPLWMKASHRWNMVKCLS